VSHAVLWEKSGVTVDLTALVLQTSGVDVRYATAINDHGLITAYSGASGLPNGYLLVPTSHGGRQESASVD
jgi:hypothetical protein